jgi:hypothetical protein
VVPQGATLPAGDSETVGVSLNGAPDGPLAAMVTLNASDGIHTIPVRANVDNPPVISGVHPAGFVCFGKNTTFYATVTDRDGVDSVTLHYGYTDNQGHQFFSSPEMTTSPRPDVPANLYSAGVGASFPRVGVLVFSVEAVDAHGRHATTPNQEVTVRVC